MDNFGHNKMDLNSFLDGAYRPTVREGGRRNPVGPEVPCAGPADMVRQIANGAIQFGAGGAFTPYAVLVNPEDKLAIQVHWAEGMGVNLWENPECAPNMIHGLFMQAAAFVSPGYYLIIDKDDYDELAVPENIR